MESTTNTPSAPETAAEIFAAAGLLLDPTGVKVRTDGKAGGFKMNHAEAGIQVRTAATAGGLTFNHGEAGIPVRTNTNAGGARLNHGEAGVPVRTSMDLSSPCGER